YRAASPVWLITESADLATLDKGNKVLPDGVAVQAGVLLDGALRDSLGLVTEQGQDRPSRGRHGAPG
ncbi:MAG TPA: hypothetical protein PKA04_09185, partial [Marmoricola sp.]|nr:hypothetical protein [Marmoricola sp.]